MKQSYICAKAYVHTMADNLLDSWRCAAQTSAAGEVHLIAANIFIVMVLCRDNKHPSTFRPRKNTPMGSKVHHCYQHLQVLWATIACILAAQ